MPSARLRGEVGLEFLHEMRHRGIVMVRCHPREGAVLIDHIYQAQITEDGNRHLRKLPDCARIIAGGSNQPSYPQNELLSSSCDRELIEHPLTLN
jgi:hypothetical protein